MESSLLESLSDCVVLIQAKRKKLRPHRSTHKIEKESLLLSKGNGDISILNSFNEAPGDAGESSKNNTSQNRESRSLGQNSKTDSAKANPRGSQDLGRGSRNASGGAGGGGGKPPPRDNKRNVQSKITLLSETDEDDETSLKPESSSAPSNVTTEVQSQPQNSGRRGAALERYKKLDRSLRDSRKPYASFIVNEPKEHSQQKTKPSLPLDNTKKSSIAHRPPQYGQTVLLEAKQSHSTVEFSRVPTQTKMSETALPTKDISSAHSLSRISEEKADSVHWEEVLDPEEFSDSEISSGNEADNLSVTDDTDRRQLDSEWLQIHMRISNIQKTAGQLKTKQQFDAFPKGKDFPNEPDFLSVMLPLYRFMMIFGRFPFRLKERNDKKKRFRFDRTSPHYISFLLTTASFGVCAFNMTHQIFDLYHQEPPFTIYNEVTAIELDKFWVNGVVTILWLYFLVISSVSLLVDGNNVVEFLNRWLESLELIQYNATWGLRQRLFVFFFLLFIYLGFIVVDFALELGWTRGSMGFTGLLVFHGFQDRLRLNLWGFRTAQYFGLVLEVYSILSAAFMLSLVGAHAWSLDMAARRFNLRLGLTLRTLMFNKPKEVPFQFQKLVPYRKLFAEYLIISTFPKIMGEAFIIVFNSFFAFIILGMVISTYAFYSSIMLSDSSITDQDYKDPFLKPDEFVPVKGNMLSHVRFLKDGTLAAGLWLICILFLELVRIPGATIMNGSRYVLRKGLIRCKTAFERRFVASMIYSYAPQSHSFVRPGFAVDRVFIGKFLGFSLGLFVTVFQFNPSRLETLTVISCDSLLHCRSITISKTIASLLPSKTLESKNISEQIQPQPVAEYSFNSTQAPLIVADIFSKFPCTLTGLRPVHFKEFTSDCGGVTIPALFTDFNESGFYSRAPVCPHKSVSGLDSSFVGNLYDCYGEPVNISSTDECGNLYLPTPGEQTHNKLSPQMPQVQLSTLIFGDSNKSELFCCFAYDGPIEMKSEAANQCNLPKGEILRESCHKKSRVTVVDRKFFETAFENVYSKYSLDSGPWVACLCQGIGELPEANSSWNPCQLLRDIIKELYQKSTTITTSTTKPPIVEQCQVESEVRLGMCYCKNNPSQTLNVSTFVQKSPMYRTCKSDSGDYFALGVVEKTEQNFLYRGSLQIAPYFCRLADLNRNGSRWNSYWPFDPEMYDCFGNEVHDGTIDDCANLKLSYPDANGKEVVPHLKPLRVSDSEYVCCWNYFVEGIDRNTQSLVKNGFCGMGGVDKNHPRKIAKYHCAFRVLVKGEKIHDGLCDYDIVFEKTLYAGDDNKLYRSNCSATKLQCYNP